MSIEASKWAWEQKGLTAAEKLVLLCLADHADDQGENCWPSQERISRKTGVGRESVNRAIKRFRALAAVDQTGKPAVGIIMVVKQTVPQMGALAYNKYKLLLSHVTICHAGTTKSHSENVTKSHSHVTSDHAPCDISADFPRDLKSHNPSEENRHKIEPPLRKAGRSEAPAVLKKVDSVLAEEPPKPWHEPFRELYMGDPRRFARLFGWCLAAENKGYAGARVADALVEFQRYDAKSKVDSWARYLDALLDRRTARTNAREFVEQHEIDKEQEAAWASQHLALA